MLVTPIFHSRPRAVARVRSHCVMRPAKTNRMVAKPSSSGINCSNMRSGVASSSTAPSSAPSTDASTRPTKARLNGGSLARSVSAARKLPALTATRFDAVATTGGRPTASSTGKVITEAPPTSDAIKPPTTPVAIRIRTVGRSTRRLLHERLDAGLGAAEDQRVDVVGALVGVHRFEVAHHAHDMEFVGDAVAAVHVAGDAGDVESLAGVVALHQRNRGRRSLAGLQHAAERQRAAKAERDLGLHVGELLLHQLIGGERAVELLAVEHIL